MGYIDDLVAAGYGGYRGWNDEAAARGDFEATDGAGKWTGGGGGTPGGSSFTPITAADFQKLEEQAFETVKPYYIQLAKEAQGNFGRAKLILEEDYKRNTRLARQNYAIQADYEEKALKNSLAQFGIKFGTEQEDLIDTLNRRGAAVYQMGPDRQINALRPGQISPTGDVSTIINAADPNLGRGGQELGRLQAEQKLRQEAVQRATAKNLSELGFNLAKVTSGTPEGQIPSTTADRSLMGSEELEYLRGTEGATRRAQLTGQELAERRRRDIQSIAGQYAQTEDRKIPTALTNQYLTNMQTDFQNLGA